MVAGRIYSKENMAHIHMDKLIKQLKTYGCNSCCNSTIMTYFFYVHINHHSIKFGWLGG